MEKRMVRSYTKYPFPSSEAEILTVGYIDPLTDTDIMMLGGHHEKQEELGPTELLKFD